MEAGSQLKKKYLINDSKYVAAQKWLLIWSFAGCAPPVGSYDPKLASKQAGGIIDKSDRFKPPKGIYRFS